MKFCHVTFVPNQSNHKIGKRHKPLSMISYYTDDESNSTKDPFDGSVDLSQHFNMPITVPLSSRRSIMPLPALLQPNTPHVPHVVHKSNVSHSSQKMHAQEVTSVSTQRHPMNQRQRLPSVEYSQPMGLSLQRRIQNLQRMNQKQMVKSTSRRFQKKPQYACHLDVCYREDMESIPSANSSLPKYRHHEHPKVRTTSDIISCRSEANLSGMTIRTQYQASSISAPIQPQARNDHLLHSTPSLPTIGAIETPKTKSTASTIVPNRKIRTSITLFELLNHDEN
ncbi:hypothetical protein C9374_008768 [Naegleria lovaniensis]|uniref:Uncharacterized protein n=1 Tax=Naegleria lovaniensis TaxID=51637 RepID=A0AA88KHF8_NAELO|nr:uncharacterized protein C9374_008768 [Naegleria lovaniensis]KAG2378146.1 hypothetical protein C9374_008768 [Naegleria lovaniensis]